MKHTKNDPVIKKLLGKNYLFPGILVNYLSCSNLSFSMIFDPITVCNLNLQNHFVKSATHEFMAEEDAKPTPKIGDIYEELAKNDVGLIITGFSYVFPGGQSMIYQQRIYDDRFIESYMKITEIVHRYEAKLYFRLIVHGGRQAVVSEEYPISLAPSEIKNELSGVVPKEITEKEILEVIAAFTKAAI